MQAYPFFLSMNVVERNISSELFMFMEQAGLRDQLHNAKFVSLSETKRITVEKPVLTLCHDVYR